jgi:large subunit ribosomal protein L5
MSGPVLQTLARVACPRRRPRNVRLSSSKSEVAPDPLAGVRPGQQHRSRLAEHYATTLAPALLYMTYDHQRTLTPPVDPRSAIRPWDPTDPYAKNRPPRRPPGGLFLRPMTRPIGPNNVVKLDHVVVSVHAKEALKDKDVLFSAIMALQAMTGESEYGKLYARHHPDNFDGNRGIEIVTTGKGSASFKVRKGVPVGVKVCLRGDAMYSFLDILGHFVLPRLKDFDGSVLPDPAKRTSTSGEAAESGTVSIGLKPEAMALFPGVEVNVDAYPKMFGFHVNMVTTARGKGSQDQARSLLSGLLRLPFVKQP